MLIQPQLIRVSLVLGLALTASNLSIQPMLEQAHFYYELMGLDQVFLVCRLSCLKLQNLKLIGSTVLVFLQKPKHCFSDDPGSLETIMKNQIQKIFR